MTRHESEIGTGSTTGVAHDERHRPTVERLVHASATEVWDVLEDGWLYPLWVVGTTRMRHVEPGWPEVGTRLHHSAGVWPLVLDDTTEVLAVDPGSEIRLRASGRPLGEAEVVLSLETVGTATRVTIAEQASSGPGRWVPRLLHDPAVWWRNTESLRRLAYLAEGRSRAED